jgi:hypothetical protein
MDGRFAARVWMSWISRLPASAVRCGAVLGRQCVLVNPLISHASSECQPSFSFGDCRSQTRARRSAQADAASEESCPQDFPSLCGLVRCGLTDWLVKQRRRPSVRKCNAGVEWFSGGRAWGGQA